MFAILGRSASPPAPRPYDKSSAQRKVKFRKKNILVVCSYEAQTLRNRCSRSLLPSYQFLERTGEVLWWNGHFTKITVLPPYITDEGFLLKNIKKHRFLEHVKFILYINWWVGRTCRGLLSSVIRTLYQMFLRFCFTNLKFWPSFKPMIIYRSAKGEVLKKKISLCPAIRLKRSEMVVLPPVCHPTNF